MPNGSKEINFFAETTFRNMRKKFGIKLDDRRRHLYVLGKTGMGKSVMLENMAIQDIQNGFGVGFIDPHGEVAEGLLDFIPSNRINDVIYINPADIDHPIAFNIMEQVSVEYRHLVAGGLMGVFKKIWPDVWSARMEYILNNCILALLEYPGATLLGVNRMLVDTEYRKKVIDHITDPVVKAFWVQEYARYTQRYEVEATAAIQNKIGQFISAPLIRNIIGQVKSSIDMRKIMDGQKIIIMNLSKGRVGEDNSRLLGALMVTKLQLAAMSRVDVPEEKRKDFFLYIDEFQNFATEAFVSILSEARKYRLALILGHQYITQMDETVRDAVFGNVGTIVAFRVGAEDAEFLEKEFMPEFMATDLVNLAKYNIYLKLMIDGLAGRPFSAQTLAPLPRPEKSLTDTIIKVSRERYGTPRKIVEEKIGKWAGVFNAPEPSKSAGSAPAAGPVLYDARCSLCGKDTKVVFPPDGVRPVYCKPCRKKLEQQKEEARGEIRQSVDAAPRMPPIGGEAGERTFTPSPIRDGDFRLRERSEERSTGGFRPAPQPRERSEERRTGAFQPRERDQRTSFFPRREGGPVRSSPAPQSRTGFSEGRAEKRWDRRETIPSFREVPREIRPLPRRSFSEGGSLPRRSFGEGGQETQAVSLEEATKKEPIPFSPARRTGEERPKPKRKEVNFDELRKVLEESLGDKNRASEPQKAELRPEQSGRNQETLSADKQAPDMNKKEDSNKDGVIEPGETIKF